MTHDVEPRTLEVPLPTGMARKKLLIRAWMATGEPAPTWNGETTTDRALSRRTPYASEQTLIYRETTWNRPRYCFLREFVVPAEIVHAGINRLDFAEGADA